MLLATCEQKAVMTNFVLCRAFLVLFPLKITKKSSFKVSVGRTTFDYGHNKSLCKVACI